jgi:hypothetical protein
VPPTPPAPPFAPITAVAWLVTEHAERAAQPPLPASAVIDPIEVFVPEPPLVAVTVPPAPPCQTVTVRVPPKVVDTEITCPPAPPPAPVLSHA